MALPYDRPTGRRLTTASGAPMDDGNDPVLIDLGLDRGDGIGDSATGRDGPWSRGWLRPVATGVCATLLLVLGGAAPPEPASLTEIATLTVSPDRGFVLTEDRLYAGAVGPAGAGQYVSGYETGRGRLLWSVPYDQGGNTGGVAERAGDLLLLRVFGQDVPRTTAVGADNGRFRWSVTAPVEVLPDGRTGMISEEIFPADAEPVDTSLPGGSDVLYFAPSGKAYAVPPVGQVIRLFDLAGGEPLWNSEPLGIAVASRLPVSGPDGHPVLVVTTLDHRVELRDARTGAVRHSLPATGTDPPSVQVFGDLLTVRRGSAELTGYDLGSFDVRWTRTLGRPDQRISVCGDRPCLGNDFGWSLLDPVTGTDVGPRGAPGSTLLQNGGQLVEMDRERAKLIRTIDPATGQTWAELSDWDTMSYSPPDRPVLLVNPTTAAGPTWFALLEPGKPEVRLLGRVPYRAADCQLAGDVIACQDRSDTIRLWRYRS
ncbi:PQQ-binding-like beta-propeller repeat protein [Micromonospora sp. NPDC050397]|uniref:outer membrane protein assembly factor BamB family protein n=1 Tax=Micromonospora sp. NPDC050397 TaxID=3364279 RepID=UPI00384E1539